MLRQSGHTIVVITGANTGESSLTEEDGHPVHRLPVPYRNEFGFLRRLWSFYRFARMSEALALQLGSFDLCYAVSTPLTTGWAALRLKKKTGLPFFFEVGDLWPDAPIALGVIRNPLLKRWLYRIERSIYREAERIVALSPPIADTVRNRIPGKEVLVIPNIADTDYFVPTSKPSDLLWHYQADGKFVITYAGALGWANGLERVVECAEECQKVKLPVLFLLVGEGSQEEPVKKLISRRGLRNIRVLPFCNRDGVRELLSITDAVFVSFRSEPILETGSPHKFFDGLAAGKLVVLNFGGWLEKLVEEHQCGLRVSEPRQFASAIRPFIEDPERLAAAQRSARNLAEDLFCYDTLSRKLAPVVSPSPPVEGAGGRGVTAGTSTP
jgi:glycosyltransferase involved in cell wall biosynthesis